MLTILVLFVGLTLATAVIAYWSDNLGKKLGKKRVSLWGMRPRTTATFLTIASSWLIMIFTLGVMLTIFPPLRQALLKFDEVQAKEGELRESATKLTGQVSELDGQLEVLQTQTQTLKRQVANASGSLTKVRGQLTQSRAAAIQARAGATAARKDADAERKSATAATKRQQEAVEREQAARDNLKDVRAQLGTTKQQRAEAQQQLGVAKTDLKQASADVKNADAKVAAANARVASADAEVRATEAQYRAAELNLRKVETDLKRAEEGKDLALFNEKAAKASANAAQDNASLAENKAIAAEARAKTAGTRATVAGESAFKSGAQAITAQAEAIRANLEAIRAKAEVAKAEKRVAQLQEQSDQLSLANAELIGVNARISGEADIILSSNILVPVGRTLVARSFEQGASFSSATQQLRALFGRAAANAPGLLPGAQLQLAPRLVPAPKLKASDPDLAVLLGEDDIYNGLATAISRSQNSLSVRLVSERNHLEGERTLYARFIVVPVRPALPTDEELARANFDGTTGDAQLFSALSKLVEVGREVAAQRGVNPPLSPEAPTFYAPGSNEQIFVTLRKISAINGPVRVRIVTAEPIDTTDQLSVRFVVEPLGTTTVNTKIRALQPAA